MINTNKLNGRIVEKGLTQEDVALHLGLSQPAVSQKINNVRPMDLDEAEKICDLLDIKDTEFGEFFFYHGVA